ncbi:NAD(P)-dependent oxidoreductase [Pedobacter nutrimenti]|uniref:NAD(P)-dependent oxidoreductase n=1 Tax=Pedobacter nutrimenti TaxID=1241337 RepID=UPI00292FFCE3|nr:NAD(P)-dependent oxidoreductase [Pedobacter nutrimenti]
MNKTKIGWIGLGNMGIPMSEQLIKAGYPLQVYNRSKEKENALKAMGAGVTSSPAELIQSSDIVILMVSDDQAVRQIFNAENGLLSVQTTGKTIVNMSTVSPGVSKEMAALSAESGHDYIDAPVSGSVKQAQEGQLVIMAGGSESTFLKVKPVLEVLGKLAKLVGETGAGNSTKLAINSLLALYAQGLAETVIFANQQGIKTEDLLTLIGQAALSNIFTKIKGDAILNDQYKAAFALKHIVKDLTLAKNEGLSSPLATTALKTFQQAEPSYGEEDIIAVIKQLNS